MDTNIVETGRSVRPTTPSLPLALSRRIHGLTPERAKILTLTREERETLTNRLTAYWEYLQRGRREDISALLTRLRGVYFVPTMTPGFAQALAEDWADDLGRFPVWLVKLACDRYRRSEPTKIPKPANIIAFCMEETEGERQEMREIELALSSNPGTSEPPPRVTPEQVGAIIDRMGMREDMDRIAAQKTRALRSAG